MKIQTLLFTALLGLAATAAFGDTPAPAAGTNAGPHGMCAKNADECTQLAAKFDQWCQANAQKCVDVKAHVEKHREMCENNKEKCKEMMHHMRHHGDQNQNGDQGGDEDGGN